MSRYQDSGEPVAACTECGCPQFYRQKDFNPLLGCGLLLIAFVLVPWTYGLSLPALWCVDLVLRRRVPDIMVCYRCRTERRGVPVPEVVAGFDHFTAMKWERKGAPSVRKAEPV